MILLVVLSVLAVWRITYMLQTEDGPRGIFRRLQAWAASKPDNIGGINNGFYCFYCLSIWVSIPFALLLTNEYFGQLKQLVYIVLVTSALSTGAIFINILHDKISN